MPSLFKKIASYSGGKKSNPYDKQANPNNPINAATVPTPTTSAFKASPPKRSASPRASHDYLAEARQAGGRDPVTGRRGPDQPRSERSETAMGGRGGEGAGAGRGIVGTGTFDGGVGAKKYDAYVQEMKDREMGGWRDPEGGYYAPERRVGEFYAPETRRG